MRYLFILLSSLVLIRCTLHHPDDRYASDFRARKVKTLIAAWGEPTEIIPIANGRTLYIYRTENYGNSSSPPAPVVGVNVSQSGRTMITTSPAFANASQGEPLTCTITFEADRSNAIVKVSTKGNNCY